MTKYKCKKCGYEGDRLVFTLTNYSYCIASNDDDPEYMGMAQEWVTAGIAEIGEPVGCPECHNWGVAEFELTEEGNAERIRTSEICKKILDDKDREAGNLSADKSIKDAL